MRALLVGGPKNGEVLQVNGDFPIIMEHDGVRYEYRRTSFSHSRLNILFPIWLWGESPNEADVLSMIKINNIDPE